MSDADSEEKITLTEAAAFVQRKFNRRRPHLNTMLRWCLQGVCGGRVKLESQKIGQVRRTTREAIIRFVERQSTPDVRRVDTAAAKRAEQELIREGI